jgi:hypothetical protein
MKNMDNLKLLQKLAKHLSHEDYDDEEEICDEDSEETEYQGKHHSSHHEDENQITDADVKAEQEEYAEDGMTEVDENLPKKRRMSPEDNKKMAILILSKKLGKRKKPM